MSDYLSVCRHQLSFNSNIIAIVKNGFRKKYFSSTKLGEAGCQDARHL